MLIKFKHVVSIGLVGMLLNLMAAADSRIAIFSDQMSSSIAGLLETQLLLNRNFQLLERRDLSSLVNEQRMARGGLTRNGLKVDFEGADLILMFESLSVEIGEKRVPHVNLVCIDVQTAGIFHSSFIRHKSASDLSWADLQVKEIQRKLKRGHDASRPIRTIAIQSITSKRYTDRITHSGNGQSQFTYYPFAAHENILKKTLSATLTTEPHLQVLDRTHLGEVHVESALNQLTTSGLNRSQFLFICYNCLQ